MQPQSLPFSGFSMYESGHPGPANQEFLPENYAASFHPMVHQGIVPGSCYREYLALPFLHRDVAINSLHTFFRIQLAFPCLSDHLLPGASPLLMGICSPSMARMGKPSLRCMGKAIVLVRCPFLKEYLGRATAEIHLATPCRSLALVSIMSISPMEADG